MRTAELILPLGTEPGFPPGLPRLCLTISRLSSHLAYSSVLFCPLQLITKYWHLRALRGNRCVDTGLPCGRRTARYPSSKVLISWLQFSAAVLWATAPRRSAAMGPHFGFTCGKSAHFPRLKCEVGRRDQEWPSHCPEERGSGPGRAQGPGPALARASAPTGFLSPRPPLLLGFAELHIGQATWHW